MLVHRKDKIDEPLAGLTKKKKERAQINKIRNGRELRIPQKYKEL